MGVHGAELTALCSQLEQIADIKQGQWQVRGYSRGECDVGTQTVYSSYL